MSDIDSLSDALEMLEKKNDIYNNAPNTIGHVLQAFFPSGIQARTSEEWARYASLINCITKLNRYVNSPGGHKDSALDLINYASMLHSRTK
jgi:hypothetical protein